MKTGTEVRQGCLSPIFFNLYSEYLTNEALERFADLKIRHIISTVIYADDLVLLRKKRLLQDTTDRLTGNGKRYGVEMNVEKPGVLGNSREPSPLQIMTDQKQLENVEYFSYLGGVITNDASCTRETISTIVTATEAFNRNKTPFTGKLD